MAANTTLSTTTNSLRRCICIVPQQRQLLLATARRKYSEYTVTAAREIKGDSHDFVPTTHSSSTQPVRVVPSSGLEKLPTGHILRNIMLGTLFTSPRLFRLGTSILSTIAHSRSTFWLNPDANPVLRALVKPLVYDQFCAGTNQAEIFQTRDRIKGMGFAGVILCYGKEVVVNKEDEGCLRATTDQERQAQEIEMWRDGNLKTLDMVGEGDWLGMKLTGAGCGITDALMSNADPPAQFTAALDAICAKAQSKGCSLWIDAEQQAVQTAIDRWAIDTMRKWNQPGRSPTVYTTIQAYLKASRTKLAHQQALAAKEGWILAVKLVRGAYIGTDPRERIHDTKEATDECYNAIVQDLLTNTSQRMGLFLAGHNPTSVARAWDIVQDLSRQGKLGVMPAFGQLQGMADELSLKIVKRCEELEAQGGNVVVPKVYKCLTWGTIRECMQYLLRRLVENSGGAERLKDGMAANWAELRRRVLRR